MALLEITDLVGGYGGAPILNGVNLAIEQSDIGVIVGPNGAGKSTTLKAIFGLLKVTGGSIRFMGQELVGMAPWYLAGRLFGLGRVRALADRFGRWFTVNAEEIDTATGFFRRYGPLIVLFGRLLPIIRTLISVPAGLAHMPVGQFVLYSTIGAVVWNTLLTGGGYLLAEHYEAIEAWLDPLTLVILATVVVVYVWRLITWRPSRKR